MNLERNSSLQPSPLGMRQDYVPAGARRHHAFCDAVVGRAATLVGCRFPKTSPCRLKAVTKAHTSTYRHSLIRLACHSLTSRPNQPAWVAREQYVAVNLFQLLLLLARMFWVLLYEVVWSEYWPPSHHLTRCSKANWATMPPSAQAGRASSAFLSHIS